MRILKNYITYTFNRNSLGFCVVVNNQNILRNKSNLNKIIIIIIHSVSYFPISSRFPFYENNSF